MREEPTRYHLTRALQGALLGFGAPAGWLLLRVIEGHDAWSELRHHPALYSYLGFGAVFAFTLFGFALGRRENRLAMLSITDSLTGLVNLRYFVHRLSEEFSIALRRAKPCAIAIVDLDHFKAINDRFGHGTGDAVLANAARAITDAVRDGDTVARVGGEEFAVLLPDSNLEGAITVAERIRANVAMMNLSAKSGKPTVTASVGVASTEVFPRLSATALYTKADQALYRAKRSGRNRVCLAIDEKPRTQDLPVDASA